MECSYCNKTYSGVSALLKHQRTNKSCLALQIKNGISIKKDIFACTFCKKELTSKLRLESHITICKSKTKSESRNVQ